MKRTIALLLTLVMLLSIVPAVSAANFTDVKAGAFYAEAVDWAVANGVTSGTSATTFSPDNTCSRGEVATFLWRALGKPTPSNTNNPFKDVPAGRFYTTPVLWALENGVTSGTSATTFTPDKACTRGEVVTFLWRAMGKPAPSNTSIPFSDVAEGRFYTTAVLWAVEKGITSGTGNGKFSPDLNCTRGQVVTFLYRAVKNGGTANTLTIIDQPKDIACEGGDTVQFSVEVTGGKAPYSYQWQFKAASESSYINLSAADEEWAAGWDTETLDVEVYNSDFVHRYSYRCIITDAAGDQVISNDAEAYETLKITTQPVNPVGVPGDTVSVSVEAAGGKAPYTYQWQYSYDDQRYYNAPLGTYFKNYNTATMSFTLEPSDFTNYDACYYRCIVTDANGNTVTSNAAQLVEEQLTASISADKTSLRYDGEQATLTVTVSGGKAPYEYEWYLSWFKDQDWKKWTPEADDYRTYPHDALGNERYIYCVVTDANGESATTRTICIYSQRTAD